ncbi:MAG: DUF3021 family protein [Clostridiales bacterium]|nr:DUF3021 family protein [Clostridiales bacterium]MBO4579984.1 DUF3021 family protein [Clostridiales bacterium]
MEDNKTVFNYLGELFSTYGIILLIFVVLNYLLGDIANGYSSFFELGKGGLTTATMLQLFLLSVIICIARNLFLTDRWIKKLRIVIRNTLFFVTITISIIIFVLLFGWFPANDITAWIGFILSFAICSVAGVLLSKLREQTENKKMEKALERFKDTED